MKKIITFLIMMFLFVFKVDAATLCAPEEQLELNGKAANIKVNYEAIETISDIFEFIGHYMKISILNLSDEFYLIVKNDVTNETSTYTIEDAVNGIITFEWHNLEQVTNFTIQIYTTDKTGCKDEKYKTLYLTLPRYNPYSEREICSENSGYYLCQKFVMFSEISESDFINQIIKYNIGTVDDNGEDIEDVDNNTLIDKIFNFIKNNKWFIVGGGIILVIFVGLFVLGKRHNYNKKKRELGL